MKCKHNDPNPPCGLCREESVTQETCLGLFQHCGKPRDPKYDLRDPTNQDRLPVYRCTECGAATDGLFDRAAAQGKLPALERAINEAEELARSERS